MMDVILILVEVATFVVGYGIMFAIFAWIDRRRNSPKRRQSRIDKLTAPGKNAWKAYAGRIAAPDNEKLEKGFRPPPVDSTLGWRGWHWNPHERCLQSPAHRTLWRDGECRVDEWCKEDVVRGVAGIHAIWPVPKDWQNKGEQLPAQDVVGIVERYGHYVLGEDGWRAEWVVVRELAADKSIIEEVRKAYPGITVHERVTREQVFDQTKFPAHGLWPGLASAAGGGSGSASMNQALNSLQNMKPGAWYPVTIPPAVIVTTMVGGGGGVGTPASLFYGQNAQNMQDTMDKIAYDIFSQAHNHMDDSPTP